jgi:hypothetical protein
MRKANLFLGMLTLALGMTQGGWADPIIRLFGATAFQNAINDGRIAGVLPNAADTRNTRNRTALNTIYGAVAPFRDSVVSTDAATVNGLVSATDAPLDADTIGAWSYAYGPDPDLSHVSLELEMNFPQINPPGSSGINRFTFAAIDTTDKVKSWGWDNPLLTSGFQLFAFDLGAGAGAGGSNPALFIEEVGFQLTNVDFLQISYRGQRGATFPNTPGGSQALWTGTRQFFVTPEPRTFLLLIVGMMGWLVWQRWRGGR